MDTPFNIDGFLDTKQKEFLLSIGKLNGIYGLLYLFFAGFLFLIGSPIAFIIAKVIFGIGLLSYYLSGYRNTSLELSILIIMGIEIYIYALFSYEKYPASIFWILLAPNYIFLLKGKITKLLFFFIILSVIVLTPLANKYLGFRGDAEISNEVFNFITIISAAFLLIINYMMIEQYIIINQKHNKILEKQNLELQETKNELIESQNFQEQFFANVSHELRTPISTISGVADLLKNQMISPELTNCLQESSKSLSMLIDDFLEYNKLRDGEILFNHNIFSIHDNIEKIGSVFAFQFEEKNLTYEVSISNKVPKYLIGDSRRLNQILLNIIGNCIKNTENGIVLMEVQIERIFARKAEVVFLITYSGEFINNKINKSRQNDYSLNIHSVLSLDWTKKIIDSNNGQFETKRYSKDVYQYKVRLNFEIPEYQTDPELEHKNDFDMSPSDLKILIVDDNRINLAISQKQILLYEKNYQIYTASDGKDCLNQCNVNKFDVILLDIRMPKISGIDVAKEIRGDENHTNHETPIIALTADVTDKTMNECKNCGINSVISKPYNIDELLSEMKKLTHEEV